MRWSFTEHPASVGETYVEHLATALGFAAAMIGGGFACAVHQRMVAARARPVAVPVEHLLGVGI
jgi:hypothetical protein